MSTLHNLSDVTLTLRDARGVVASCPVADVASYEDGSIIFDVLSEEAADVLALARRQGPYDCAESHDVSVYTLVVQVARGDETLIEGIGPITAEVTERGVAFLVRRALLL
jgi:hypothetical protein